MRALSGRTLVGHIYFRPLYCGKLFSLCARARPGAIALTLEHVTKYVCVLIYLADVIASSGSLGEVGDLWGLRPVQQMLA